MSKNNLIVEFTIPLYIRQYIKSKSVRTKFYSKESKLPSSFEDKKYYWKDFKVISAGKKVIKEYLVDDKGERIVANESKAGKPKVENINGQGIYNGKIKEHDRNNMITQIHNSFKPYVATISKITSYPIRIDVYMFDQIEDAVFTRHQDWDVDNRFLPYGKALSDVLKSEGKIDEDNRYYITEPPHPIFVPVDDKEDRKLVVRIFKDDRPIILNNYFYKKKHGTKTE